MVSEWHEAIRIYHIVMAHTAVLLNRTREPTSMLMSFCDPFYRHETLNTAHVNSMHSSINVQESIFKRVYKSKTLMYRNTTYTQVLQIQLLIKLFIASPSYRINKLTILICFTFYQNYQE